MIFISFSYFTSADMVKGATHIRNKSRSTAVFMIDDLRPDQFIALKENSLKHDDIDLCKELYGNKLPWKFFGPNKDQLAMRASYARLAESKVFRPHSFKILDKFPCTAPVIDCVISDLKANYGGHVIPSIEYLEDIQSRRCVSNATLSLGHSIKEITIGASTNAEIESAIHFFNEHYAKENSECPMGIASMNVEYIEVLDSDYSKLPDSGITSSNRVVFTRNPVNVKESVRIPALISIGGLKWSLIIRFDIDTSISSDDIVCYQLNNSVIQDKLKQFLENIPTVAGVDMKTKMNDIENFISRMSPTPLKLKNGWIELEVLAAAAGFNSQSRSLFNLNFMILGGILSKNNPKGDGLWSLQWNKLPNPFKTYLIGDSRACYNIYVILHSCLKINLFPDPEPLCIAANKSQNAIAIWFADLTRELFKGLELDIKAYDKAITRKDLIYAIRPREISRVCYGEENCSYETQLKSSPTQQVQNFAELLPQWSNVCFGGARFLHQVRNTFAKQHKVLLDITVKSVENIFDTPLTGDMYNLITYAQPDYKIDLTAITELPFLAQDPNISLKPADFDVNTVLNKDFSNLAKEQGRPARLLTLEMLRLRHPDETLKLLERASEKGGSKREFRFWLPSLSRYEEIRISYLYLTNKFADTSCKWAENKISGALELAQKKIDQDLKDKEDQLTLAKSRLAALNQAKTDDLYKNRAKIQDQLPPPISSGKPLTESQRNKRRIRRQLYRQKKKLRRENATATATSTCDDPTEEHIYIEEEDEPPFEEQRILKIVDEEEADEDSFYSRVVRDFEDVNN